MASVRTIVLAAVSVTLVTQDSVAQVDAPALAETRFKTASGPADPQASEDTVQLLIRIQHQAQHQAQHEAKPGGGSFWSGQNMGHTNRKIDAGYWRNVQRLVDETGQRPTVLGLDYGFNVIGRGYAHANRYLVFHWQQCGLVSISMHPRNPWRWSTANDTRIGDFDVLFREGTAANQRWMGVLDRVADGLEELQEAGVVVLWRPLHEMNGGWFWWAGDSRGRRVTPDEFARLWRHMFDYLTKSRNLHNILWVYAPTAVYDPSQRPVNEYFPGDEYVDIVGLDYYGDPAAPALRDGLTELAKLRKPVVISEFGFEAEPTGSADNRQLVRALANIPVRPAYVMYWHSWNNLPVAIIDHQHPREVLKGDHH